MRNNKFILTSNIYLTAGLSSIITENEDMNPDTSMIFIDLDSPPIKAPFNKKEYSQLFYITTKHTTEAYKQLIKDLIGEGTFISFNNKLEHIKEVLRNGIPQKNRLPIPMSSSSLTKREIKIIKTLFSGVSVSKCAIVFGLSAKTISAHKRNAMTKLEIRNTQELFTILNSIHTLISLHSQ